MLGALVPPLSTFVGASLASASASSGVAMPFGVKIAPCGIGGGSGVGVRIVRLDALLGRLGRRHHLVHVGARHLLRVDLVLDDRRRQARMLGGACAASGSSR